LVQLDRGFWALASTGAPVAAHRLGVERLAMTALLLPRLSVVAFALAILVACEAARPPLSRAEAIGSADSLLLREHVVWGPVVATMPPDGADAEGRRWWQISFGPDANGQQRIILVDEISRWARFADTDYVARVPATGIERTVSARLDAGPWILDVMGDAAQPMEQRAQVEVDAADLNNLARRTGLLPVFSARSTRDGRMTIVWGWQDDHGTVQDEKVREWLDLRTRFHDSRWIDLLQ
jgi:hypothetical protein